VVQHTYISLSPAAYCKPVRSWHSGATGQAIGHQYVGNVTMVWEAEMFKKFKKFEGFNGDAAICGGK
jgi:hypothetical protein